LIMRCFAGGTDIAEHLVENGLALAYRRYSTDYVAAETIARDRGTGSGPAPSRHPGTGVAAIDVLLTMTVTKGLTNRRGSAIFGAWKQTTPPRGRP